MFVWVVSEVFVLLQVIMSEYSSFQQIHVSFALF